MSKNLNFSGGCYVLFTFIYNWLPGHLTVKLNQKPTETHSLESYILSTFILCGSTVKFLSFREQSL